MNVREQKVAPDETLVSFDVSALFSSIPVSIALEVINRQFTENINQTGIEIFWNILNLYPKSSSLLELVLNNCVFFWGKFYQQLQGAAMGSPVSPVIANIYMKYFEEIALDPQCPIPIPGGKDL